HGGAGDDRRVPFGHVARGERHPEPDEAEPPEQQHDAPRPRLFLGIPGSAVRFCGCHESSPSGRAMCGRRAEEGGYHGRRTQQAPALYDERPSLGWAAPTMAIIELTEMARPA